MITFIIQHREFFELLGIWIAKEWSKVKAVTPAVWQWWTDNGGLNGIVGQFRNGKQQQEKDKTNEKVSVSS